MSASIVHLIGSMNTCILCALSIGSNVLSFGMSTSILPLVVSISACILYVV